MTDVSPFRGLRYDPARCDLSRVIVPPYDVITPEERVAFYERDPHCAIRLELTKDVSAERDTDYSEVARTLADWQREGALVRDAKPALYGLRQRYVAPDGGERVREGFFAALRLEPYERRIVRPHERTLAGPKADRLKILRATRANLSSVFLLYEDREQALAQTLAPAFARAPAAVAKDDLGVEHALWRFDDADLHAAVSRFLAGRPVVIADGHHRYETALAYAAERAAAEPTAGPDAPWRSTLAYFANAYAPGSLLLPIHRVVKKGPAPTEAAWRERLAGWRHETVRVAAAGDVPAALSKHLAPRAPAPSFAADDGSGVLHVAWRERRGDELAIRAVHEEVIGGVLGLDETAVREGAIDFPKDARRAAEDVRAGRGAVAIYLNALTPDDVFRVTAAGEILPQKSTFFLPKLPTGLVFRPHEAAA
jgi:uncharacterized protein (DUF1015 family)